MIGRNITSQGARLWHMELAPYETAWNYLCNLQIMFVLNILQMS